MSGFEFKTVSYRVEALVVALVGELAEVKLTVAGVPGFVLLQADAGLVGSVVKHELVVAASAALAAVELLGFDTRQGGGVVVTVLAAGKPAGGSGGGSGGGACYLIVSSVILPQSVVEAGYHHRTVDVAVKEINQYFLPESWQLDAAPVITRGGG